MRQRKYRRIQRDVLTLFPETDRVCSKCRQRLPRDAFNPSTIAKDGLQSQCRECQKPARRAAYRERVVEFAQRHVERTYGLDAEAYAAMVAAQGNACAICGDDMGQGKRRHVDHCHATGAVRALLCSRCNSCLGLAGDSPERLRVMADYIERYRLDEAAD